MQTLVELLSRSACDYPELPAVGLYGSAPWRWTYAELWDASLRAAAYLRAHGVDTGDRVIMWGPNRPEWVAGFFGVVLLGACVVPFDVRSREDLLDRIEGLTGPAHLLIGREQASQLERNHAPQTLLDDFRAAIANVDPIAIDDGNVGPDDTAELVFTSGTTGNPKGVILTHRNIVSNVEMARSAVLPTPKYRVLSILPLSHMYEQTGGLLTPLSGGASITYLSSLRPDVIFSAMNETRATTMCCVPQVLQLFRQGIEREIRKQGRERQFARFHAFARRLPLRARRAIFGSVHRRMGGAFEFFLSGGAHLDPALGGWWEGLGIKVLQGYGMTEASPIVATNTLTDRDVESVGRPLPGIDVRFAEDREILVRGANVTAGYWQDPLTTEAAFVDGWYRTGDLGYLDGAGRLHLHGRKKNMVVLPNGMNVYPEDLERVLVADAGVKDAVVLGLERDQEVDVHAVLLLEKPAGLPDAIVKRANALLAPHQQIRSYTVWPDEQFPMTPTLKVKRADIAARLAEMRSAGSRARAD